MVAERHVSWEPSRFQDWMLVLLMAVTALGLLGWRSALAWRQPQLPPEHISLQGRLVEYQQSMDSLPLFQDNNVQIAARIPSEASQAWDAALFSILAAEAGEPEKAEALAQKAPPAFQRCFPVAYQEQDSIPSDADRRAIQAALREGYAATLLKARLAERTDPTHTAMLREHAQAWATPRIMGLAITGLTILALIPTGIGFALYMAVSRRSPWPGPELPVAGSRLALACSGWFLAFVLSSLVIGLLAAHVRLLQPFAIPLAYGIHAAAGLWLLAHAEGTTFGTLLARWRRRGQSLWWAPAFVAVAVAAVLAIAVTLGPFLARYAPSQQPLIDLVAEHQDAWSTVVIFLTLAVLAPCFEEILFRGTLLPWLSHRLSARWGLRRGRWGALALSSLAFGAIHFQPTALPTLSALGFVLGLAYLRTQSLPVAMLVHGLWNAGVFLFYRLIFA